MQVQSLSQEHPPQEGMATHSSILAMDRAAHGQRSLAGHSPWGHRESDVREHMSTGLQAAATYEI